MARKRTRGTLELMIQFVELSPQTCLAVTRLGGFTIRGERSTTTFDAVRSLFMGLAGRPEVSSHVDAAIALDLALAGTTLESVATADDADRPLGFLVEGAKRG